MTIAAQIDRAFVRISDGQVHLRRIDGEPGLRPLVLIHLSPLSSATLEGLMRQLRAAGFKAPMVAPDTLGNGDSCPPAVAAPDIAYYAGAVVRLLDALGYDKVDLFGSHTGGRIACEMAVAFPDRVGRLIIDGISEYDAQTQALYKERYTPPITPDPLGAHLLQAFHYMRNQFLYFPWFEQDAAHSLTTDMPSPEALHGMAMELLKSRATYHQAYGAAFAYPAKTRVAALTAPTLLLKPEGGVPSLIAAADDYANGRNVLAQAVAKGEPAMAQAIAAFLADGG